MFRQILAVALFVLGSAAAIAQETAEPPVPDKRLIVTRNVDFFGSDLQPLFDTTLQSCERACLNDPQCRAFTYNQNASACFPKFDIGASEPFEGAVSARVVTVSPVRVARGVAHAADLDFLTPDDLTRARAEALALAVRHGAGQWTPEALREAADDRRARQEWANAIHWTGAALAQTDEAADWITYAEWSADYAERLRGGDRRKYRTRAFLAAINAVLRADTDAQHAHALHVLAQTLEVQGRGRAMISALRQAVDLSPRADLEAALLDAVEKYGFRIQSHSVEVELAAPRLCVSFSETLLRAGHDYTPYVQLPDQRLAVTADSNRICIDGLQHGARYAVTFRAGLPAESGETLLRDVPIQAYVRDRSPRVAFPGRAYVLPRGPEAGLPVQTVNTETLDLTLWRVSDRNLTAALRDKVLTEPMSRWDAQRLTRDLAEEIWTGTAEVQMALNQDRTTRLPMGEALQDQPAGVYVLSATLPGADPDDQDRANQWFVLSDIGLTTLTGADGLTVAARSLGTAEPMQDLRVALVSRANRVLAETVTDAQGIARFAPALLRGRQGAAPALVTARRGEEDLAFLSIAGPAFDLSDRGVAGREAPGPLDAYLFTDRGAYRAGDQINATVLLRDAKAFAVPDVPLVAVLTRPDGVEHARHLSRDDVDGGHVFALPLSPTVPRGPWSLAIHADPAADPLTSATLLVEDFVPERIDFDLSLPDGPVAARVPPLLGVEARFLFGAPGADLGIEGDVVLATRAQVPDLPGWRFGRHDDAPVIRRDYLPGGLVTDADGRATIPLALPEIKAAGRPMELTTVLRLSEGSGRPVERRISRPVLPDGPVIGLRPGFTDTLPEGAEARFDLQGFAPDLSPEPMEVRWRINRVTQRYQWYETYGTWRWEPVTRRETIASGVAHLGADPVTVAAPVTWGRYELVAERLDGAYTASSTSFAAGWFTSAETVDSPDVLELTLDKTAYRVGDEARLRIVPRAPGTAIVTVMADRVISMQAVPVPEGASTLTLPVTDDWGAGAYVSAQVIRPVTDTGSRVPTRALGLAHAAVDPGARHLAVSFDAPAEAAPRTPLSLAVQVGGPQPPGAMAHVTVAAVDLGILNLTAHPDPDPAGHFFGQRRLGVDIRDLYGRLIDGRSGAMGTIRSGGDAAISASLQSPPPTEDLVALFQGPVQVDETGQARLSFDLPDFNGTLRLMAMAWTADGVGAAQTDVLVRDPVVISAAMPRFLAPGDAARLLLDLTHVKGAAGAMPLTVTAAGLDLGTVPATVDLAPEARARVDIPLRAVTTGDFVIDIALTTPDGHRLTRSLTLGVRSNDPAQGVTRRFALAPGQQFALDQAVFAGMRPDSASALMSAGPLARFDAPGLLAALDRYPYGCTEQVTSRAMPLLYLSALAEPLGLGDAARSRERIDQAIAQVLTRQASNGGFGLWRAVSGDPWLDAYVTDFLSRARMAGHEVPDRAMEAALDNLANQLAYAGRPKAGESGLPYVLYVLAREGRAAMGDLRYYADEYARDFTPLGRAQLGAALASYGDQRRADRMFDLAQRGITATTSDAGYRRDFGTHRRDAAAVLTLAVEARTEVVDRAALVDRIAATSGRSSTQEQAWSLLAANAMISDPTVLGLSLNGAPVLGPLARRFDALDHDPVMLRNTGAGDVDVTLTVLGVPEGQTEARGFGYALDRSYYTMEGLPLDGPVQVGDRLVTVLTVRPAQDVRARLMVDDPLPAGLEIDNPNLLRAGDLRALDWLDTKDAEHAEFRADRFRAAVNQQGSGPIRLAYVVRAISPGEFHHPAALVEDMYRPDFRATTASARLTIAP